MSEAPVILSEWPRNGRETIRISLSRYRGGMTIEVREWYPDAGTLKRGRKGITFSVKHLRKLETAITTAIRIAEAEGVLGAKEAGR
jgi:Transcriptional Coactivator p15 (PC4)